MDRLGNGTKFTREPIYKFFNVFEIGTFDMKTKSPRTRNRNPILKYLSAPIFENDVVKTFRAGILHSIYSFSVFSIGFYLIVLLVSKPFNEIIPLVIYLGLSIFIILGLFYTVQRGWVGFSSTFFVFLAWGIIITGAITGGITSAPAYYNLFIPLFIAGVLFGSKGIRGFIGPILLTIYGLYYLENNNLWKINWIEHTPFTKMVLAVSFFVVLSILTFITISRVETTITQLREEIDKRINSEKKVVRLNKELMKSYDNTLEGWAKALELKDKETEGHSRRVTILSWKLAKELGIAEEKLISIRHGALLHDIGKMGIADKILNKPGPLTEEERALMERHTISAYNLLKDIAFLQEALEIPYYHHEKWNGEGYPKGLSGEEIPISARIFAVVDVWDALISDRPYRKAWEKEKAIEYLKAQSGKHFDPVVVSAFLEKIISVEGIDID